MCVIVNNKIQLDEIHSHRNMQTHKHSNNSHVNPSVFASVKLPILSICQLATLQTQPELYSEGCSFLRSLLISTNRLALATNNNNTNNNDNMQHTIFTHNTLPKPHRNVWIGPFIWGCGCYQPGKSLRKSV